MIALALGAPRDSEDARVARIATILDRDVSCPDCGLEELRIPREADRDGGTDLVCPDCGAGLELTTGE